MDILVIILASIGVLSIIYGLIHFFSHIYMIHENTEKILKILEEEDGQSEDI